MNDIFISYSHIDDQAVDDVHEGLERVTAERGHATPAQEHRQVGDEQRLDDRRGGLRARADQPQLDGRALAGFAPNIERAADGVKTIGVLPQGFPPFTLPSV